MERHLKRITHIWFPSHLVASRGVEVKIVLKIKFSNFENLLISYYLEFHFFHPFFSFEVALRTTNSVQEPKLFHISSDNQPIFRRPNFLE